MGEAFNLLSSKRFTNTAFRYVEFLKIFACIEEMHGANARKRERWIIIVDLRSHDRISSCTNKFKSESL